MARANLHLICGNCGSNDEWKWQHVPKEKVGDDVMQDEDVFLTCRNCSTLHSLNDNAKCEEIVNKTSKE
jgi:hypothetical protein